MEKKYIVKLDDNKLAYTAIIIDGVPYIKPLQLLPYAEPDMEQVKRDYDAWYEKGLADAWDAARKISRMNTSQHIDVFDSWYTNTIIENFSASEAIEKIQAYEQEKEKEIQVGDEVVGTYTSEEETEPFVIIRKIPEIHPTYYFGIYSKSGEFCQGGLKLKKTGRHFPEIAEVLQKMKETE